MRRASEFTAQSSRGHNKAGAARPRSLLPSWRSPPALMVLRSSLRERQGLGPREGRDAMDGDHGTSQSMVRRPGMLA
jgi:hypothetical protein